MSETTEFPLPADATDEERATAKTEIGKHTTVVKEAPHAITFEGRWLGQTGPIWHFQYLRLYAVPNGYLIAGHDIREGIKVAFAKDPAGLAAAFEQPNVRELIEEELRFRKIPGAEHARA